MERHIFRAYDVRGVVNRDLTPSDAACIGVAFGTFLGGEGRVLIGRDVRVTSRILESAFTAGLAATGVNVASTGDVPIPVANFKTMIGDFEAGAYVTASHNPPEYNGVRLRREDGTGYTWENEEVWRRALKGDVKLAKWSEVGSITVLDERESIEEYKRYLLDRVELGRKVKVVLDIGNGSAYSTAPTLMREAGAEVSTIFAEPDGTFPNRPSEPSDSTLTELKRKVVSAGADFGVGFDGDADRAIFVDGSGKTVATEKIGILLARDIMERRGAGVVVANVSISMIMEEEIGKLGGSVKRVRVGDVFIAEAIKEHGAVLGIESSAHIFLPEFYIFDDPILATLEVARILSEEDRSLSSLVSEIPSYPYEEFSFPCGDDIKFQVMERIIEGLRSEGLELDLTDGVKVNLNEGWILLRPSNTSPKIRAAVEARSQEGLQRLKELATKRFEEAKESVTQGSGSII